MLFLGMRIENIYKLLFKSVSKDTTINMMSEKGLSFIELIVASLLVSVLATLSLNSVAVFREGAYHSQVAIYKNDTLSALSAGRVDYNMETTNGIEQAVFYSDGSSPTFTNTTIDALLPGFNHDSNLNITVSTNPQCIIGKGVTPCIIEAVYLHHCKTSVEKQVTRFDNDLTIEIPVPATPSC